MDVFDVHERLIDNYSAFTSSLVQVRAELIAAHLQSEHDDKVCWPDPWCRTTRTTLGQRHR